LSEEPCETPDSSPDYIHAHHRASDMPHCQDHSGMTSKVDLIIWLLGLLLLSGAYQILFQFPSVKQEVVMEVKSLTARIVEVEKKNITLTDDIANIKQDQLIIKKRL